METIREFRPANRYLYDFKMCRGKDGWAQVDTSQDASYFGTWANPTRLEILTYVEGDVIKRIAETKEEFANEIRSIKKWNEEMGFEFIGIDGMCKNDLIKKFKDIGLEDLLH